MSDRLQKGDIVAPSPLGISEGGLDRKIRGIVCATPRYSRARAYVSVRIGAAQKRGTYKPADWWFKVR